MASAPPAAGEPARAPTFLPFVSTVWPSFVRPDVASDCVFGTSPAANGPRATPSSSIGAVSQSCSGVGGGCTGSAPPPAHGSPGGYVAASLEPGALQTVRS